MMPMRLPIVPRLLVPAIACGLAACAAPPVAEDGSSADAIQQDQSASSLTGRYAPARSGSLDAALDLLVARETPGKALLQGRLLVQPQGTHRTSDSYVSRDGIPFDPTSCALTFSGILTKPESDGPVTVDVEVQDASGRSHGQLRFETVGALGRLAGSQSLALTLDRPMAACTNALAPRGDLTRGIAFERAGGLPNRDTVLEFRTLVKAVTPYRPPVGYASGLGHPAPLESASAGEPVAVVRRSGDAVTIRVDRFVYGEITTPLTTSASEDDLAPQPAEVKAMLKIAAP